MSDPNVGRKWESPEGIKELVGVHPSGAYLVKVGDQPFPQLIKPDALASEIAFDEKAAASRRRGRQEFEEQRAQEEQQRITEDFTYGFAEQFPPTKRRRVIDTLNKQIRSSGEYVSRKELIVRKVGDGWRVESRQLVSPNGNSFFFEKDLTKIGLDFARYLIEQKNGTRERRLKQKLLR
jgi:hypothetical protein